VPESSNPYQFVYNNPLVYSDPTGEFSITELNASRYIQDRLPVAQKYIASRAREYVEDWVGEVVGSVLNGVINRLVPGSLMGEHFNKIVDEIGAGNRFERYLRGQVCGNFYSFAGQYADQLWITPSVSSVTGEPTGNGFNCSESIRLRGRVTPEISDRRHQSQPDFMIKNGTPTDENRKASLIGDIKITVEKAVEQIKAGHPQWQAMFKHAEEYQHLPFVTYIAFKDRFGRSAYTSDADLEAEIHSVVARALRRRKVILVIASIFD